MHSRRILPVLLLLFVASGCAALVYEVVWFQLLQLVIGSSSVSLAVLLGTFMGGLCLGSFTFSRFVSAKHHPMQVYAVLELGIGAIGLLVLFGMPLVSGVYTSWAGSGVWGLILRGLAAGICLLPPTVLMGATLPALSRSVETTPVGVSWLGFFYAGNILGAVLGSLLAGFYLLRVYDIPTATYAAVAINAAVALVAWGLSYTIKVDEPATPTTAPESVAGSTALHIAIGLSGMTALAAEVIWTRYLSLLFGATTYTFSLILAAFLVGLGIGSSIGSALGRTVSRPRIVFGWCQALLGVAIAWAAYMLTDSMPYWPIDPSIAKNPWFNFQIDFVRCLWVVLPGAILWGASFPLALASVAKPGHDPAQLVGRLYGANTVGAILGSLVGGLLLVVWLGSQHAQQVLILFTALSALLVLMPTGKDQPQGAGLRFAADAILIGVGSTLLAVLAVHELPGLLVAYGRYSATRVGQADVFYVGEGINASVAVSRLSDGTLNYHNAGKVQASSEAQDMRLQRLLGHMTTLVPANPRSVLVIGCGAGVTAGAVSVDPRVERLTIAEIEPLVPRTVSTYFSRYNYDVVRNPKTTVRIDDARHFILTSNEKFDAVTSDPLDPWVKGAAMLYTKEFFELVKQHLNPGGVVTLFVQLYWSNEEAVKSELATFFEAFPNGVVWGNTYQGGGYDLVLMGQVEPTVINLDEVESRLHRPEYATVATSLREIGVNSIIDLFATYAGQARDLGPWLKDAAITHDSNLRLQYLAGMGVNLNIGPSIYNGLLAYRRQPNALFTGSDQMKSALWAAMQNAGR
ncbi:MAG: fused MFS/spermidine synthase [Acidobacteria bacterium]|nr:fused MFS/spermidine synthase [Acidobacteriota bacterium]